MNEAERRLQLDAFLPYKLNIVTQAVSQGLARLYAEEFGISVPEWRIIATLGQLELGEEMTSRDISRHSRMGKVMTSRAATTLARRRLMTRRINRDDRRETLLRLTDKGQDMYRAIVPRAIAYQARLEEGLSRADAAALDRIIAHLMKHAEDHETLQRNGERLYD